VTDLSRCFHYKGSKKKGYFIPAILIGILSVACNPTKYVPSDETLLDDYKISINRESVKKSEVIPYIKQKPNKRIFGTRFHLGLYNLSNIEKEKWPHAWLRRIGEEPVIYDQYSTVKSKDQVKSYLTGKGYFDGTVGETVETANRKTKVWFDLRLNSPYIVRKIIYNIEDQILSTIVFADSIDCIIEKNKAYDVDKLMAEKSRLERLVRDYGFYSFSGDNISFRIDSMVGNRHVDIYYDVTKYLRIGRDNIPVRVPHIQYRIGKIFIYPDYIPRDVLSGGEEFQKSLDTTEYRGFYFIQGTGKPIVKYDRIIESLYIKPGSVFHQTNTERSQSHLMSLKVYRLVNIRYSEVTEAALKPGSTGELDCNIQLTPWSRQSFSVELEGTNSGGNLGGALNLIYQNKNLLRGAEQFSLKLKGAYETFTQSSTGIQSTQEYGAEASLRIPRFLIPFLESENFVRKYNPVTNIQFAYNYQNLPVYTRTVANASFGYMWNGNAYITHMVSPLQMNLVRIPSIDPDYYANVIEQSSYLLNSYKDVLIGGGSYSFVYSDQKITKKKDHWFVRFNAETSGNLLRSFMSISGRELTTDTVSSYYRLLGQPFAQYVRSDIDIRYNRIINDVSSIVYRAFIGVGIPYSNSVAMPFEKQYFEGGANGIRGWQVRSLGPGSYQPPTSKFVNQTGDIKLEANLEYRFKLFWILEGAAFIDAGNIWAIRKDDARPGSQFRLNKFYDDIAIGSGLGMRLDLKFVLLRTDFGIKIRDPKFTGSERWIFSRPDPGLKGNSAIVIAIGYPF
jgi:outer membrane protein assembly factor BamA